MPRILLRGRDGVLYNGNDYWATNNGQWATRNGKRWLPPKRWHTIMYQCVVRANCMFVTSSMLMGRINFLTSVRSHVTHAWRVVMCARSARKCLHKLHICCFCSKKVIFLGVWFYENMNSKIDLLLQTPKTPKVDWTWWMVFQSVYPIKFTFVVP